MEEIAQLDDERFFCRWGARHQAINCRVSDPLGYLEVKVIACLIGPGVHSEVRIAHRIDREKVVIRNLRFPYNPRLPFNALR